MVLSENHPALFLYAFVIMQAAMNFYLGAVRIKCKMFNKDAVQICHSHASIHVFLVASLVSSLGINLFRPVQDRAPNECPCAADPAACLTIHPFNHIVETDAHSILVEQVTVQQHFSFTATNQFFDLTRYTVISSWKHGIRAGLILSLPKLQ